MLAEKNKPTVSAARIKKNNTEHTVLLLSIQPEDSDSYCLFKIFLYADYI